MTKVKGMDKFMLTWNELVKHLIEVKRCWRTLGKLHGKYNLNVGQFPDKSQKILSRVSYRSSFTIGIVRFLEYIAQYGELEDCLVQITKKKDEEAIEWQTKVEMETKEMREAV